jgi:tetratricopeptide (TPR) repeat protein
MSMTNNMNIRAGLLAMLVAAPLAGVVALAPIGDAAAQEQQKGGWRKETADKVKEAQTAGQKGDYAGAIRLLKEAKAKGSLSATEEQGINELLIWAACGAKDNRLVIQTVNERIATGRVGGADLARKLRLLATTHYALREYRDTIGSLNKLAANQALNTDDLVLLGNSQVQLGDFKSASVTLEKAVAAAEKAGRPASVRSKLLLALHQAYDKTGNDAKRMETLHRLMVAAPSKDSFKWISSAFAKQSNRDPVVMISLYRLGFSRNLLSNEHYAEYAEAALDLSSPGEAVTMLEKGMAAGAIKKDDRNNRLLADAKGQVERLKASLPQQEREAKAIATGEPEAKLATAYYTLKNYSKAAEAAKRGVEKGKVQRPDGLNMLLGIALAQSKRPAEAKNAFKAAGAANAQVRGVANLWADMVG